MAKISEQANYQSSEKQHKYLKYICDLDSQKRTTNV